ncbi:DUF6461 domain-containing protein [Streptomyces sp. NPDC023723]|uniref:DUF6461 domain-containing protein n=1 Tax=Streptomyces sp. NPDC023723 TaxID=3154323 RepID=UPI0033F36124
MTAMTTAADYAWLEDEYAFLTEAYCLTLVRDITPETLLAELGAAATRRVTGVPGLERPSFDAWQEHGGTRLLVAAAPLGDWTLMAEINGYVGVTPSVMLPVSRSRTVVAHFRNINAVDHFYWLEDGRIQVHFEPLFPDDRDGSRPDGLLTEMRESGFVLDSDEDDEATGHTEAVFALAHRVTGIRMTPELLNTADFSCALVRRP